METKLPLASEVRAAVEAYRATDATRDLDVYLERMHEAILKAKSCGLWGVSVEVPGRLHPALVKIGEEAGYYTTSSTNRQFYMDEINLHWGCPPAKRQS